MKENLRTILRCTGLAAVVIAALVLIPAAAEAQCTPGIHGASIFKQCTSPKNSCTSDADCNDGLFCNGAEVCATPGEPGSNVVDCTITLTNPTNHCDQFTVEEACDLILNGTALQNCDILVTGTSGVVSGAGCDAGSNLGPGETCTLNVGSSITWQANYYVIQPTDPDPLPDQATVTVRDVCDQSPTGCNSGTTNDVEFTASTDLESGCSPGTPVECPADADLCTGPEFCDEELDACNPGPAIVCEQDTDLCTAPTACVPATGLCEPTGPDVTCPDDNDLCTAPEVCDPTTGLCVPDGADVVCEDPTCEICVPETGLCVDRDPLPAECVPSEEICRTPGFWGTHGGNEKANATNITLAVLDAFNANNDPDLQICGQTISNTDLGSVNSALEAICVSPKGDQVLQLARQLTAAALNCILSSAIGTDAASCGASLGDGDVCDGVSISEFFDACNAACAAGDVTIDHDADAGTAEVSCIGLIDCFNNGGVITAEGGCDEATGETCHDRDLVTDCFDFPSPGPAGSPRECNDSRKNDVEITD